MFRDRVSVASVACLCVLAAVCVVRGEPDNSDVTPFLGLHFNFYDPVQHALMELYVKSAKSIDYRVVLGSVAGAQCVKDQLTDVSRLDRELVRLSWEEPSGTVQSNILNLHTWRYHRAVAFAHWTIHNSTLRVSGPMYAPRNLEQLLVWRNKTLAANKFPVPVVDSLLPLFLEKLAPNRNDLIVCPPVGAPMLPALPIEPEPVLRQELSAKTPFGLIYNYTYIKAANATSAPVTNSSTPFAGNTQTFVLYLKNATEVDFIVRFGPPRNMIHCQKDERTYYTTVGDDFTRMSWQGMGLYGGAWENNVVSPRRKWHQGATFMPVTTATFPMGPDGFPHVYGLASTIWANITQLTYKHANDETLIPCSAQIIHT